MIKIVGKEAKKWLIRLNESPYYTFKLRSTPKGNRILIFPKETKQTQWVELNLPTQQYFNNLGIDEKLFNNLSEDEKKNLIKCHGK